MAATPDEYTTRQEEPTDSQFTVARTKIYRMCKGLKRKNRKVSKQVEVPEQGAKETSPERKKTKRVTFKVVDEIFVIPTRHENSLREVEEMESEIEGGRTNVTKVKKRIVQEGDSEGIAVRVKGRRRGGESLNGLKKFFKSVLEQELENDS